MLRKAILTAGLALTVVAAEEPKTAGVAPEQALARLMAGNERYRSSHLTHPHESAEWRHSLSKEQHPFATILSCSDSRVPPELLFDVGLGDLFVIRVAGNIASDDVLGSIEYAAEHLGSSLILVMGHERCGAVQAAIGGGEPKTHIESLTRAIDPAVARAKKEKGELIANAVRLNVEMVVEQVRASRPILADLAAKGRIKVAGAVYDLDTGEVSLLP
jgi:carbonic anhydrase